MKRGSNSTIINWSVEMYTLLLERFPSDCYLSNSIQVFFLEYFQNNFVEKFGQEEFDRQMARASRNMVQIKNDKIERERLRIEEQEEKLKTKRQKLQEKIGLQNVQKESERRVQRKMDREEILEYNRKHPDSPLEMPKELEEETASHVENGKSGEESADEEDPEEFLKDVEAENERKKKAAEAKALRDMKNYVRDAKKEGE